MDEADIETYARALSQVAAAYHCTLEAHGPTVGGVAWKDEGGQTRRFAALCAGIDPAVPLAVNDVGCGYGALFGYLDRRFQLRAYCGTDVCEAMVEAAAARVADPRARFVQNAVPVSVADWSLASGTFNMSAGAEDRVWVPLVQEVVAAMAVRSRVGFAFNMLRPSWRSDFLWGSEPEPWVAFCRDRLGGRPELVEGPEPEEWSLVVRRS